MYLNNVFKCNVLCYVTVLYIILVMDAKIKEATRIWRKGCYHLYNRTRARPDARKSEGFLNRNAEWRNLLTSRNWKLEDREVRLLRGDVLASFFQADYFASRPNERGHRTRKIRALLFHIARFAVKDRKIFIDCNELPVPLAQVTI